MDSLRTTIVGGTGFLGSRLADRLLRAGHRVRVVARHGAADLGSSPGGPRLEGVCADVLDLESLRPAVATAEVVFNLVGAVSLPSPKAYFDLQERGARNVARAARDADAARLIHISALGVDTGAPSAADRSKAAGEAAVRAVFPQATLVRPSLLFGEGDHFFSRNAEDTASRHRGERVIPVRRLSRDEVAPEIKRLDLLILGGGGILFDSEAKTFLREATLAHELGVPVMVYAVSAGPLKDPAVQRLVCDCLDPAALVTVRERESRRVLEEAGLKREVEVTADPALLLQPESVTRTVLQREGLDGERRRVGISVREPGGAAPAVSEDTYHALLANAADFIVDRFDSDVVLVPLEREVQDMQHSHAVVARMLRAERATVLRGQYTPGQLLSLVGRFDFAIGMRLHFLIFAALQGVPFVALPYASKVRGFLAHLGLETPPLEQVNAGRLIAYIDQAWDRRRSLVKRVQRKLPPLRAQASRTHELLLKLLEGPLERAR